MWQDAFWTGVGGWLVIVLLGLWSIDRRLAQLVAIAAGRAGGAGRTERQDL